MVRFPFPLLTLAAALIAAPVTAQTSPTALLGTPTEAQTPEVRTPEPQAAPAPALASRFAAPALEESELGRTAGRADLSQESRNSQVAGVSGSSVNGTSRTGAVTIDGNAFQNMSGLTVVNANSGNNVAMNGAMTVNVAITPKP